jgi:cation-transporting ATPase E
VLTAVALWVLVCLARPFNWWRTLLVASMVVAVTVTMLVPLARDFYALRLPPAGDAWAMVLFAIAGAVAIEVVWRATRRILGRRDPALLEYG